MKRGRERMKRERATERSVCAIVHGLKAVLGLKAVHNVYIRKRERKGERREEERRKREKGREKGERKRDGEGREREREREGREKEES